MFDYFDEMNPHEKAMALGSQMLLKSIYLARNGQRPPEGAFSWAARVNSKTWATGMLTREIERAAIQMAQKERARELVVSREPCFKCGVRADIGCKHRRVA